MASSVVAMTLPSKGFGIDVEAQRRNLGLAVEDVELEGADVGRHMAD